jgi:hypothetical protein
MQTTEDRLSAVERQLGILSRVLTEQQLRLHDMEKNETILLGIASGQERALKELQERTERIESRLDVMDGKLDTILSLLEKP